jgi:hypothetical protein
MLRWHLSRAVPLRDAGGRIVRWLGTNTDIHDQKLASEESLRRLASEEHLRLRRGRISFLLPPRERLAHPRAMRSLSPSRPRAALLAALLATAAATTAIAAPGCSGDDPTSSSSSSSSSSSGGSGTGGGPLAGVALLDAAYCVPLAALVCAEAAACGCGSAPGWPATADACRATITARCDAVPPLVMAGLASGEIVVDAAASAACLADLEAQSGRCGLVAGAACKRILALHLALGEACSEPLCADGAGYCSPSGGACQPLPASSGAACETLCGGDLLCASGACVARKPALSACAADLECAAPARCVAGGCRAPAAKGAACAATADCAVGLACAPTGHCVAPPPTCAEPDACGNASSCYATSAPACAAVHATGATCADGSQCAAPDYCDATTHQCTAKPAPGAPCSDSVICAAGLACDPATTKCGPPPANGQPCALGSMGPIECAASLGCLDGTCGPLPTEGEACAIPNRCAPGLGCDFATNGSFCVKPHGAGEACTNDSVCVDGLYCDLAALTCAPIVPAGGGCSDGNECGPKGTCLPTAPGGKDFSCAPFPGVGEPCFLDCKAGAYCAPNVAPGPCAPDLCKLALGG